MQDERKDVGKRRSKKAIPFTLCLSLKPLCARFRFSTASVSQPFPCMSFPACLPLLLLLCTCTQLILCAMPTAAEQADRDSERRDGRRETKTEEERAFALACPCHCITHAYTDAHMQTPHAPRLPVHQLCGAVKVALMNMFAWKWRRHKERERGWQKRGRLIC